MTTQAPSNSMRRWADRVAALVCGEIGTSAVEFALAAPILMGLLVPMADLGMAFSDQIEVQQAAAAGAQYAALHPWNSNSATAIANAVTAATTLAVTASPAPSQTCGCPSSSTVAYRRLRQHVLRMGKPPGTTSSSTRKRPIPRNCRIRCWAAR